MRGREVVAFLLAMEASIGDWELTIANPKARRAYCSFDATRRDAVWVRRVVGYAKAGRLMIEKWFEAEAWRRGVSLFPGFLTDDRRCAL